MLAVRWRRVRSLLSSISLPSSPTLRPRRCPLASAAQAMSPKPAIQPSPVTDPESKSPEAAM